MPLPSQDQLELAHHLIQLGALGDTPQPLTAIQKGQLLALIVELLEQFGPVLIQLLIDLLLKPNATE